MTIKKKTLYELLEISPNVSNSEIQAAHQRLTEIIQSQKTYSNREEIDFKLKVIKVASQTLTVDRTRAAYDARLAMLNAPATVAAPINMVTLPHHPEVMSLKADAVSFKADAMSFKADAMSLKADAMSLRLTGAPLKIEGGHQSTSKAIFSFITSLRSPLTKVLTIIGSLIAAGMAIQVAFILMVNHQQEHATAEVSKAEEKVMLQEYYQTYGVRPGSKIEADLLEVENRRKENAQREAAHEQERKDEEYRRFVEESRRIGEAVSDNLRRDEQAARYEEQRKQQELAQEKFAQEEAERRRIEEDRRQVEEARRKLGLN